MKILIFSDVSQNICWNVMNWNRDGQRLSVIIAWILKRRDFYQSPFAVLQPRQLFHRLQIWSQRRVKSWGLSRRRFPLALLSCFARWWCRDWSSKCSPPWLGWLVTAGQTLCTYYVPWHSSSPSHLHQDTGSSYWRMVIDSLEYNSCPGSWCIVYCRVCGGSKLQPAHNQGGMSPITNSSSLVSPRTVLFNFLIPGCMSMFRRMSPPKLDMHAGLKLGREDKNELYISALAFRWVSHSSLR